MSGLTPIMESMIEQMQSDYVAHLSIIDRHGNPQIIMSCTALRRFALPSGQIIPFLGTVDCAYMDAVHALVPMVIFLVAVVAWPARDRTEVRKRIMLAALILPCVVGLAAPMVLVGLEHRGRNPDLYGGGGGEMTALLQPFAFMEMGGRWLFPVLGAVLSIQLASMNWTRAARV